MLGSIRLTHLTIRATKIQCRGRRVGEKAQEELGTITGWLGESLFIVTKTIPNTSKHHQKLAPKTTSFEESQQKRLSRSTGSKQRTWRSIARESRRGMDHWHGIGRCKLHRELVACFGVWLPSWELTYPIERWWFSFSRWVGYVSSIFLVPWFVTHLRSPYGTTRKQCRHCVNCRWRNHVAAPSERPPWRWMGVFVRFP